MGRKVRSLMLWQPPSVDCIKMNFDRACDMKNSFSGLGVVFQDCRGELKGTMAVPQVGNLPPRSVEALALLHGLRFALHVGFLNLEVEGDALSVISSINNSLDDLSLEGHILDEVKLLVQSFSFCSGHFVKREGNGIAHRLAKEALKISQPFLCLESGPEWLH
ncbi:putative ribonuclease H-like domain-containing protein [Rosa chinensis]|uniref:Putative ribonuclease H-like domain-containing protein n=1 Tax=Rosa chinensis TaxID=74649 RepID=A0A2P6PVQ5_ROSCH|nr:putative ribonuclease H-like domain-containing protein [Rosa chinensis]